MLSVPVIAEYDGIVVDGVDVVVVTGLVVVVDPGETDGGVHATNARASPNADINAMTPRTLT
jgi:hypothetical protein